MSACARIVLQLLVLLARATWRCTPTEAAVAFGVQHILGNELTTSIMRSSRRVGKAAALVAN